MGKPFPASQRELPCRMKCDIPPDEEIRFVEPGEPTDATESVFHCPNSNCGRIIASRPRRIADADGN